MQNSTRLFGKETKQKWIELRKKILEQPDESAHWEELTNLLLLRLETRYFRPIDRILRMRKTWGEGFAAMTLICSLIEFLQSCYEGKTFHHGAEESKFIYGKSSKKFKCFLEGHDPFKTIFSKPIANPTKHCKTYADDFYSNVRCGLLHEAATNNGWIIKTFSTQNEIQDFVEFVDDNNKIIFRDNFFIALKTYTLKYSKEIIDNKQDNNNVSLRDNICRKIDSLSSIHDESAKWWK